MRAPQSSQPLLLLTNGPMYRYMYSREPVTLIPGPIGHTGVAVRLPIRPGISSSCVSKQVTQPEVVPRFNIAIVPISSTQSRI